MPWLSPHHSPPVSPSTSTNGATSSASGSATHSVTYIPPLIDGACGTIAIPQRPLIYQLRDDVRVAIRLLPSLIRGAAAIQWHSLSRMDIVEMAQHAGLAMLELCMLVWAVPLWMCLPGSLFAAWLGCCMAMILGMSWTLNRGGAAKSTARSSSPADGWMMGPDADDEWWFFVGGMGLSLRSLTQSTLPGLSRLFNRSVATIHSPTYGFPFDLILSLLLRGPLHGISPCACSGGLYAQVRTALLDRKTSRTVIMAHNTGAICASHVLRRLYADIPAERIARLEVYTFGAAAAEFVMPLGGPGSSGLVAATTTTSTTNTIAEGKRPAGQQLQGQLHLHAAGIIDHREPHIEHFAFASDPFARMGVLRSVREGLEGRFCGGVFVLNCSGVHEADSRSAQRSSRRPLMSMNDYMSCLFPQINYNTMSSSAGATGSRQCCSCSSILDGVMNMDRDVAEKREFAAMANCTGTASAGTQRSKRLSWTGLGATANGMNGNMDGVAGLEMARKGCRDCGGHKGRDVSRLVRYARSVSQVNGLDKKSLAEAAGMVQ